MDGQYIFLIISFLLKFHFLTNSDFQKSQIHNNFLNYRIFNSNHLDLHYSINFIFLIKHHKLIYIYEDNK